MKKLITILLIISHWVFADEAVFLNKNDPAPYDGFLITPAKVQEIKQVKFERDTYLKLNESYDKSLKLQEDINSKNQDKIKLLLDQNDKLAKTAYDSQSINTLEKALWFVGGMVAVGLGAYGISQVSR